MESEVCRDEPPLKNEEGSAKAAKKETFWTTEVVALVSSVSVCVLVLIPVWYKTTEVYRSPLPYVDIQNFSTQPIPPRLTYTVLVFNLAPELTSLSFVREVEEKLNGRSVRFGQFHMQVSFVLSLQTTDKRKALEILKSDPNGNVSAVIPVTGVGHYSVFIVPNDILRKHTADEVWLSSSRHAMLSQGEVSVMASRLEQAIVTLSGVDALQDLATTSFGQWSSKLDMDTLRKVKVSQGYQISLTMINPDPGQLQASWNVEQATEEILLPFLADECMSKLGNFSISSQVFYYTDVHLIPKKDKNQEFHFVTADQLPPMISSVESKLGSHVSQWPTLNFIIYLPRKDESPLHIVEKKGQPPVDWFLVPQWGGVMFYNWPELDMNSSATSSVDVRVDVVMLGIVEQLKLLFGITSSKELNDKLLTTTKWQVDNILIQRMLESVSNAVSSLLSLVQLLDEVKNMVISDHIQLEVITALDSISKCYEASSVGDLELAIQEAKAALQSAETAFFDPSILALLYFPDDQKFAIYVPLFLPTSIPIVLSLASLIKKWKTRQ